MLMSTHSFAVTTPQPGDWVKYKLMPASEAKPPVVSYLTIAVGAVEKMEKSDAQWWQITAEKADGRKLTVTALSDRVPMTGKDGDIGVVYRYIFTEQDRTPLEYVNESTGLAYLPMFGFRDGLIPTPRFTNYTGAFIGTGNYLGQAMAVADFGTNGKPLVINSLMRIVLNDDVLIGTSRMFKDDGTGTGLDKEYKYVELTSDDYDTMIDAGFNLFWANDKHANYVRDRNVFIIKSSFGTDPYPELLYRSNYWGTAMYTDEPAVRLDASDCVSVYDAANLLKLRDHTYHLAPGSHIDNIIKLINKEKFTLGDWKPEQVHVPVWETVHESAFYQMQSGAAGLVHEGRYVLSGFNGYLQGILGEGVDCDVPQMLDMTYGFMRGAARCFNKEWGTAIYGQCDYKIAPDAVKQAYDMGAHFIWFWTSDHDHHLPFTQQLELTSIMREYQKEHPRENRRNQLNSAKVAVAIPNGYICTGGSMWGNTRFREDKLNEFGVPYGDITAEAYWQMYKLAKAGVDFDAVIDVPDVIDNAGYLQIIRIGADGRTNLPKPKMPEKPVSVTLEKSVSVKQYQPKPDAPKAVAHYAKSGSITIDGKFSDWQDAKWLQPDIKLMYTPPAKWDGNSDLSAKVAFAYDESAIYIAAQVRDDAHVAQKSGDMIWMNDSLQVSFDPLFNPHKERFYAMDDSEIGFSLVNGKPYAHRWEPRLAGAPGEIQGAKVAIIRTGDETRYEARVPFTSLWPLTPSFPGKCGMSFAVNDTDKDTRKGTLAWTHGLADIKNPSEFGVLEFEGSGKIKNAAPMAFAQAEKTVVKHGEDVLLHFDTGTRSERSGELTVTVRHDDAKTPPSVIKLKIPTGMNRFQIKLNTSSLESDRYTADMAFKADGKPTIEQSFRFYVLP